MQFYHDGRSSNHEFVRFSTLPHDMGISGDIVSSTSDGNEACLMDVIVTPWGRGKPYKNRHPSSKSRVSLCIVVTADAIGCQGIANKPQETRRK